jgi:hypothetical protein
MHSCEQKSVISEDTSFTGNVNIFPLANQDRSATDLIVRKLTGAGRFTTRPIQFRTALMKGKKRHYKCKIQPAKHAVILCNMLNHPEHSS